MKILLVSMKFDYGDKKRGLALDYYYFEEPLKKMGLDVINFDYMTVSQAKGKKLMNEELLEFVLLEKPDLTVVVPFTDQFIPDVMDEVKKHTKTVVYYFDDVWRLEYSKFWSKHFSYATTSDINGIKKWEEAGCNNFIYSPFGCNHHFYKEKNLPKIYEVSFVGGYHPYRAWVFKRLKKAGIIVKAFGHGWPNGRLGFNEMVDVFNQSKININLSNNESWDLRYILSPMKGFKNNLNVIRNTVRNIINNDAKNREMVKARHFEINACGGFQLSYYTQGLEKHYEIGNEIAIYESIDDLIDKIRYYLRHEDERKIIAQNGYARTIQDHTMDKRLSDLFDLIGLKNWRNE